MAQCKNIVQNWCVTAKIVQNRERGSLMSYFFPWSAFTSKTDCIDQQVSAFRDRDLDELYKMKQYRTIASHQFPFLKILTSDPTWAWGSAVMCKANLCITPESRSTGPWGPTGLTRAEVHMITEVGKAVKWAKCASSMQQMNQLPRPFCNSLWCTNF